MCLCCCCSLLLLFVRAHHVHTHLTYNSVCSFNKEFHSLQPNHTYEQHLLGGWCSCLELCIAKHVHASETLYYPTTRSLFLHKFTPNETCYSNVWRVCVLLLRSKLWSCDYSTQVDMKERKCCATVYSCSHKTHTAAPYSVSNSQFTMWHMQSQEELLNTCTADQKITIEYDREHQCVLTALTSLNLWVHNSKTQLRSISLPLLDLGNARCYEASLCHALKQAHIMLVHQSQPSK